jgi:hypothetical protein
MTSFHSLSTLSAKIHHLEAVLRADAPGELLDKYSGFVGSVICGLMLREGLDDPDMIRMASGSEREQVVQRISRILTDPYASDWYFSALDRLSIGHTAMANPRGGLGKSRRKPVEQGCFTTENRMQNHQLIPPLPIPPPSLPRPLNREIRPMPVAGSKGVVHASITNTTQQLHRFGRASDNRVRHVQPIARTLSLLTR